MVQPVIRMIGVAVATLALAACLLLPGKFDSTMTVEKDGRFAFTYKGEIQLVAMQAMLKRAKEQQAAKSFEPSACWSDKTGDERNCTNDELDQQRKNWDEQQTNAAKQDAQMRGVFGGMMGGLDPDKPDNIDEFARNLERVEGWNSVKHVGDGVFLVDYAIKGMLDRDFVFPVIPGYALGEPIFQVQRWKGGRIKVAAPALRDNGSTMLGMLGKGMPGASGSDDGPKFKPVEGSFTLSTDAEVLTNNTEEGPSIAGGRKMLRWVISQGKATPPESLLMLAGGQ